MRYIYLIFLCVTTICKVLYAGVLPPHVRYDETGAPVYIFVCGNQVTERDEINHDKDFINTLEMLLRGDINTIPVLKRQKLYLEITRNPELKKLFNFPLIRLDYFLFKNTKIIFDDHKSAIQNILLKIKQRAHNRACKGSGLEANPTVNYKPIYKGYTCTFHCGAGSILNETAASEIAKNHKLVKWMTDNGCGGSGLLGEYSELGDCSKAPSTYEGVSTKPNYSKIKCISYKEVFNKGTYFTNTFKERAALKLLEDMVEADKNLKNTDAIELSTFATSILGNNGITLATRKKYIDFIFKYIKRYPERSSRFTRQRAKWLSIVSKVILSGMNTKKDSAIFKYVFEKAEGFVSGLLYEKNLDVAARTALIKGFKTTGTNVMTKKGILSYFYSGVKVDEASFKQNITQALGHLFRTHDGGEAIKIFSDSLKKSLVLDFPTRQKVIAIIRGATGLDAAKRILEYSEFINEKPKIPEPEFRIKPKWELE